MSATTGFVALSLAMSTRCFAAVAVLTLAFSGGCGQSLFDSNPGDDGADGPDDGGDDPDPDAGQDGSDDGDDPDAGPSDPDAAPQATCPAPCAGDAVAEFSSTQGNPWSYLVDDGDPSGLGYQDLVFGDFASLNAWRDGEAAIASCNDSAGAEVCAGLSDYLLVYPGVPGGSRAVLSFEPPETAGYRLSGAVRVGAGQPLDVPISIILGRVGRHDAISVRTIRTSEEDVALDAVFPAVAGEEIYLTIGSPEEAPPVAMRVFFTRIDEGAGAFPGSCELSVTFDGDDALVDDCRGVDIFDQTDDVDFPDLSQAGASASERLGQGRVFAEHQYMTLGVAPLDYSGDFTIQFWARAGTLPFGAAYYADWNTAVRGGVAIFTEQDDDSLVFCRMENGSPSGGKDDCLLTTEPDDGQWHFFRAVRSTEDASFSLCIDGEEAIRRPVPAGADLTSDEPPRIARNVVYNPAYYVGEMDQIRVSTEALPCETN